MSLRIPPAVTVLVLLCARLITAQLAVQSPTTPMEHAPQVVNGVVNVESASGATASAKLASAIAACASVGCSRVEVPASMGPGFWTMPLPTNVTVWDYRSGSLRIFTSNESNTPGSGVGISVYVNPNNWPVVNPGVNNPVAGYFNINTNSTDYPVWGINPVVTCVTGYDTSCLGGEIDVVNNSADQAQPSTSNPKVGLNFTSAGTFAATAIVTAYAQAYHGGWHHGFYLDGLGDDIISFYAGQPQLFTLGTAVRPSASQQSIAVNNKRNTIPFVGNWITCDTGSNQENVQITSANPALYTISGVFTKSHAINTNCAQYSANRGFDFTHGMFKDTVMLLGNLKEIAGTNSGVAPNFAIIDNAGMERISELWNPRTNTTEFHDIGGGFNWKSEDKAYLMILGSNGDLDVAANVAIHGNNVLPASLTGYHGTNGAKVQMSDGTGMAGNEVVFASDGSLTNSTAGSVGHVTCWKAVGQIGFCSSAIDSNGTCTCN